MKRRSKHHRFTNSTGFITLRHSDSGGPYQSQGEKRAAICALVKPGVAKVHLQTPVIWYRPDGGKRRRYTGDMNITFEGNVPAEVWEVKRERDLQRHPELTEKFAVLEKEFAKRGAKFRVVTEKDYLDEEYPMKRFVFDYVNLDPHPQDEEIAQFIRARGTATVAEVLLAFCGDDQGKAARFIPAIWRLVAIRRLCTDFKKNFDDTANLSAPPAGLP